MMILKRLNAFDFANEVLQDESCKKRFSFDGLLALYRYLETSHNGKEKYTILETSLIKTGFAEIDRKELKSKEYLRKNYLFGKEKTYMAIERLNNKKILCAICYEEEYKK